jgi:hypothetical protein
MSGSCSECSKWKRAVRGQHGWKIGMGLCDNVPMYFDATEPPDSDSPERPVTMPESSVTISGIRIWHSDDAT